MKPVFIYEIGLLLAEDASRSAKPPKTLTQFEFRLIPHQPETRNLRSKNRDPTLETRSVGSKAYLDQKLISHKVSFKSFCKSRFPHKFVNLSFTISNIKNTLTNSYGN